MSILRWLISALAITATAAFLYIGLHADTLSPLVEIRCCTVPVRNADGSISRSSAVIAAFKRAHACPSTHLHIGPCPDWILDHPLPLDCGGVDAVYNLQWLPIDMWKAKSLWERKVYGGNGISKGCP